MALPEGIVNRPYKYVKKKTVGFPMPIALNDKLDDFCEETKCGKANFINMAIENELAKWNGSSKGKKDLKKIHRVRRESRRPEPISWRDRQAIAGVRE